MSRICHGLTELDSESDFKNCLQSLKMAEATEEMAEETKLKTHTRVQSGCIKI